MTKTIQLGEPPMSYSPAIIRREHSAWHSSPRPGRTNPDTSPTPPKGFGADSRVDPFTDRHAPSARQGGFHAPLSDSETDARIAPGGVRLHNARSAASDSHASIIAPTLMPHSAAGRSFKMRPRHFGQVLYAAPCMDSVHRQLARVAATDATVFIIGQTGTGKELVAHSIHTLSKRARGGFLAVNCGAIAANLVESELFGHERGSFTGAQQVHKGHFERASGGTLLLDEITEMPIELQVKLLRVLETGRIMRVGGTKEIEVDVRMVAATNRDPMDAVKEGKLREDLMYRLSVFPLHVPALKDRGAEVLLLAEHFLRKLNRGAGTRKTFSEEAKVQIGRYGWPGNVRELKNLVSRAHILSDDVIGAELIPSGENPGLHMTPSQPSAPAPAPEQCFAPVGTSLAEVEKQLILQTLHRNDGNKPQTAEMLGISLKTLYNRLNSYRDDEVQ